MTAPEPASPSAVHDDVPRGECVERVPAARAGEAAPAKPDAPKKQEDRTSLLEWVKAVGMPAVTLTVTVIGGYYLTSLAKEREARESNDRLYAQLLTQREQSDATVRKDMFGVVINRFLDAKTEDPANRVLQLELLANNFCQSLDFAPLFKDLARSLARDTKLPPAQRAELRKRLDLTAANLIYKQVNSLARRGFSRFSQVSLADWEKSYGKPILDEAIPRSRLVPSAPGSRPAAGEPLRISVEVVGVNLDAREIEIRLRADFSNPADTDVDRHFWVGQYDFPMLDNTQLPYGLRASVVITEFVVPDAQEAREANSFVNVHLVVFPSASASFKERQDYDDILTDMLRARGRQ
jgi:hypothetical protein